ncbi:MAG: M20 family metallopeptidase [Thermoplasmata archaeon]
MSKRRTNTGPNDFGIDDKEVLRLSRELIRIPSIYKHEHRISKFIYAKLKGWRFSPRMVPVAGHGPDVVAEVGSRRHPAIVLNGHMDTVEVAQGWKHDPFGAKVENGLLYGLGALDMKCGLAAMMLAFRSLADSGSVSGFRVMFQAVSGEEDNGIGTGTLISKGFFRKSRAVIVGEGFGGLAVVTNARRGGSYYDIDVTGKSAHGATPHLGVDAISDAAAIVCALGSMRFRSAEDLLGDDFRPLTESQAVLRIQGGTMSLSVPDRCSIRLVRSTIPGTNVDASAQIRSLVRKLHLRSRVRVRLIDEPGELYYPYITEPSSELVKAAIETVREVTGKRPRLVCGVSEADDNLIAHELRVPVISVGPGESGDLGRYHQAEECIRVSQLGDAARIYRDLVLRLGSLMSA